MRALYFHIGYVLRGWQLSFAAFIGNFALDEHEVLNVWKKETCCLHIIWSGWIWIKESFMCDPSHQSFCDKKMSHIAVSVK